MTTPSLHEGMENAYKDAGSGAAISLIQKLSGTNGTPLPAEPTTVLRVARTTLNLLATTLDERSNPAATQWMLDAALERLAREATARRVDPDHETLIRNALHALYAEETGQQYRG